MSDTLSNNDIGLIYDRECPVCRYYADHVDVATGRLVGINAREQSEHLGRVTSAGLDIDKGMALMVGDTIYFGSDAVHELALRSSGKGVFNRTVAAIFRRRRLARTLYPVLVACRNLLLKILRRSRINNLDLADNNRF